jgi:hypothetical protein
MTAFAKATSVKRARVRLDRLVGCHVRAANNRSIGRIEEFRAERDGDSWQVTACVIGRAGLWERLGGGARLLLWGTRRQNGYVARWDQIDFSNPASPRLLCTVDELDPL